MTVCRFSNTGPQGCEQSSVFIKEPGSSTIQFWVLYQNTASNWTLYLKESHCLHEECICRMFKCESKDAESDIHKIKKEAILTSANAQFSLKSEDTQQWGKIALNRRFPYKACSLLMFWQLILRKELKIWFCYLLVQLNVLQNLDGLIVVSQQWMEAQKTHKTEVPQHFIQRMAAILPSHTLRVT